MKIDGGTFKGFLIRMEGPGSIGLNLTGSEETNVKIEEMFCADSGAEGVTHTNNEDKTEIMASYDIAEEGDYMIDVTIVVSNTGDVSEYYHSSYTVQAGKDEDQPEETDPSPEGNATEAPGTSSGTTISAAMGLVGAVVAML